MTNEPNASEQDKVAATVSKGLKYDTDKPRMDLLSGLWIEGVSSVLSFGARKYASHNWRKGIERSRLLGAALRHIFAYLRGEDRDPETGLLHLYHASCCLMFASELHFTRPDLDDRYKEPEKQPNPSPVSFKSLAPKQNEFPPYPEGLVRARCEDPGCFCQSGRIPKGNGCK